MERLQRIKELVEQKQQIDKELADLKDVVKAERAAFALKPPKPRKKNRAAYPWESNKAKPRRSGLFSYRLHGASHPSSNPHLPITSRSRHSSRCPLGN